MAKKYTTEPLIYSILKYTKFTTITIVDPVNSSDYSSGWVIDINGKTVAVVGDSWIDSEIRPERKLNHCGDIRNYLTSKGATAICSGAYEHNDKSASDAAIIEKKYTCFAGKSWAASGVALFRSAINQGPDIIICNFGINDFSGIIGSDGCHFNVTKICEKAGGIIRDRIKKVLNSVTLGNITLICWGIIPVWFTGDHGSNYNYSKEDTNSMVNKLNQGISLACQDKGALYVDPYSALGVNTYNTLVDHLFPNSYHLGGDDWKTWVHKMLDASFVNAGYGRASAGAATGGSLTKGNFRPCGGLDFPLDPNLFGANRYMVAGCVFRGADPVEKKYLDKIKYFNIKCVISLRGMNQAEFCKTYPKVNNPETYKTSYENLNNREAQAKAIKDILGHDVAFYNCPVNMDSSEWYRAYGLFFNEIAKGHPVFVFCGSGKDRTGSFIDEVLTHVGVTLEARKADARKSETAGFTSYHIPGGNGKRFPFKKNTWPIGTVNKKTVYLSEKTYNDALNILRGK